MRGVTASAPFSLQSGFDPVDEAAWTALARDALAGKPLSSLSSHSSGIEVKPLFRASDRPAARAAPAASQKLDIRAIIEPRDGQEANVLALEALEGGARSVELRILADAPGLATPSGLSAALHGVMLDLAPIALDARTCDLEAAQSLAAIVSPRADAKVAALAFNLDPIADTLRSGVIDAHRYQRSLALAADLAGRYREAQVLRADARAAHEAGAFAATELGCLAAHVADYLGALIEAGLSPNRAATAILATVSVGAESLVEIAKLRAARRILARLAQAAGAETGVSPPLQAVTARRMLTTVDAPTNLVRACAAGFASLAGGAKIVSILGHADAIGRADAQQRRLARNMAHILAEEAQVSAVADPGGGAFAIDALTETLAQRAWAQFQDILAAGGPAAFAQSGALKDKIAVERQSMLARIETRKDAITGVSDFPLLDERVVLAGERPPLRPTGPNGLAPIRLSEGFERHRARADRAATDTGARPLAFAAILGPLAKAAPRIGFVENLLAAGGIRLISSDSLYSEEAALAAAFAQSGAKIAVLCGTDEAYAARAGLAAKALKQARCARLYLAGRPGEAEAGYRAAGVDDFWYMGQNAVEALADLHRALGLL